MPEYGFTLAHIFPLKEKIYDSLLITGYASQKKPLFGHALNSEGRKINRGFQWINFLG